MVVPVTAVTAAVVAAVVGAVVAAVVGGGVLAVVRVCAVGVGMGVAVGVGLRRGRHGWSCPFLQCLHGVGLRGAGSGGAVTISGRCSWY